MNCSDSIEKLNDYVDGTLNRVDAEAIKLHLANCPACQRELASLRTLLAVASKLQKEITPQRDLWPEIKSQLAKPDVSGGLSEGAPAASPPRLARFLMQWPGFAIAASLTVLAGTAGAWWWLHHRSVTAWDVASISGAPTVNAREIRGTGLLHLGQWLETDQSARAKVSVGSIGEVSVEPNSRLRLIAATPRDHRLELAHGSMSAIIWAPPRLFFVDTPSATAVDLGCSYTLKVDDHGAGVLEVTSGYVALEHDGRESIIPRGLRCLTRRGFGPGTPFAADAPLRDALEQFDFGDSATRANALAEILTQARPEDAVTLWHLLARTRPVECGQVFDALARTNPPPAGVTRAGIVAGDASMRKIWAGDLRLAGYLMR